MRPKTFRSRVQVRAGHFGRNSGRGKQTPRSLSIRTISPERNSGLPSPKRWRQKQTFDPRWTLFFTPHSAAIEPELIARAKGSWWWNEAPSRFDIAGIRAGAQRARDAHCTGFIPSLECYSYVETHEEFGEPWLNGRRQVPLGFGWLAEGASPYRELPMRAARLAYREF